MLSKCSFDREYARPGYSRQVLGEDRPPGVSIDIFFDHTHDGAARRWCGVVEQIRILMRLTEEQRARKGLAKTRRESSGYRRGPGIDLVGEVLTELVHERAARFAEVDFRVELEMRNGFPGERSELHFEKPWGERQIARLLTGFRLHV